MNRMGDKSLFYREGWKHPIQTGALYESTPATVAEIVKRTTSTVRQVVVEFGSGTGVIPAGLMAEGVLTPDSVLILIEKNKKFVDELRKTITDSRVRIFHDSAANIRAILSACGEDAMDVAISSIPYSVMLPWNRKKIVSKTAENLRRPHGKHLVININPAVEKPLKKFFPYVTSMRLPHDIEGHDLTFYEALVTPPQNGNAH